MLGTGWLLLLMVASLHSHNAQSLATSETYISVSTNCMESSTPLSLSVREATGQSGFEPCVEINEALESLTSHTTLQLQPGAHRLRERELQRSSRREKISIMGTTEETVLLSCENNAGLAFVNVSGLTISNITITGCGLSHQALNASLAHLEEILSLFYVIPTGLRIGVLIGSCRDVTFDGVIITNTSGLGLLGVNVLGHSDFRHVTLTRNTRVSCEMEPKAITTENAYKQIGGGALLIYQDNRHPEEPFISEYQSDMRVNKTLEILTVSHSLFQYNAGCSNAAKTSMVNRIFEHFHTDERYLIGGGGGLSVFLTQRTYRVEVKIESSKFYRNDAIEGGGAYVGIFTGVDRSLVSIADCTFEENGLVSVVEGESRIADSACLNGAGLVIRTDMTKPNHPEARVETAPLVRIVGTNFSSNVAMNYGGGLMADSAYTTPTPSLDTNTHQHHLTHWSLEDCLFDGNKATYGSAGYFYKQKSTRQHGKGTVLLMVRNVSMERSMHVTHLGQSAIPFSSSGLELENIAVNIRSKLTCTDNQVTAILIRSSVVNVEGDTEVCFKRNVGFTGGALHMEGENSLIILNNNSSVIFESNTATLKGGAIYVASSTSHQLKFKGPYSSCFIQPPPNIPGQLSTVRFTKNTALLGGAVYGSTLTSCSWAKQMGITEQQNIYQALYKRKGFMKFDSYPNSTKIVSTLPIKMSAEATNHPKMNDKLSLQLYPGQRAKLIIKIFDALGQLVPSVVQAITYSEQVAARLGTAGSWFVNYHNHPYLTVTGPEKSSFNVTLVETLSLISVIFSVSLLPCSTGFTYNASKKSCECHSSLTQRDIKCNMENLEELVVPPNMWIGLLNSLSSNNKTVTGDLIFSKCPLRYCNELNTSITPPNFDALCKAGSMHAGVLCGTCVANHSAVLGRYNKCAVCSDEWLLLIPAFAILGVVLFLCIGLLQLTVDKGWMYIIIFYCNTITLYSYFIPTFSTHYLLLVPASLVSLQVGYELCFYDGMTTSAHIALQLAFPVYLYLLMFVFALLSKRLSWLSRRFSPTQTLLTLSVMSYTSILETCVSAIFSIRLSTLEGDNSSLRWLGDASVFYFNGWHAVLVILSGILLLFYIIPFPIVMLFPVVAYKYTKHFKPFFDAMWAPYKLKFRFWLGVRMLALVAIYLIAYMYSSSAMGVLLFGLILLILNQFQSSLQPFRSKWVNAVDGCLTMTIVLLLFLTYPSSYTESAYQVLPIRAQEAFIVVCLGVAYILVVVALICNFAIRFLNTERLGVKCFKSACCTKVRKELQRRKHKGDSTSVRNHSSIELVGHTATSFRVQSHHRIRRSSFTHLRETLLEN